MDLNAAAAIVASVGGVLNVPVRDVSNETRVETAVGAIDASGELLVGDGDTVEGDVDDCEDTVTVDGGSLHIPLINSMRDMRSGIRCM